MKQNEYNIFKVRITSSPEPLWNVFWVFCGINVGVSLEISFHFFPQSLHLQLFYQNYNYKVFPSIDCLMISNDKFSIPHLDFRNFLKWKNDCHHQNVVFHVENRNSKNLLHLYLDMIKMTLLLCSIPSSIFAMIVIPARKSLW